MRITTLSKSLLVLTFIYGSANGHGRENTSPNNCPEIAVEVFPDPGVIPPVPYEVLIGYTDCKGVKHTRVAPHSYGPAYVESNSPFSIYVKNWAGSPPIFTVNVGHANTMVIGCGGKEYSPPGPHCWVVRRN